MALYSIELRRYIDHFTQYERPQPPIKRRIEVGQPHLFDFDYPFFDESKRKEFERKWIRRFYMREVGFETIELFKFHLENWMNERMPYYNQRFKSELIKFDPLMNTVMDREKNKTIDGSRTDDITTKGNKNGTFHVDTKDNGKFHTDSQADNDGISNSTGNYNADGTVTQKGDSLENQTTTKVGDNTVNSNGTNFVRNLDEDTPDGRLDITTEDGKGIIRYASKIHESTGKNTNQDVTSIDERGTRQTTGETNDSSVSHDEGKTTNQTTTENHETAKVDGTTENSGFQDGRNNEDTTGNSNLDQKTNQKGNETEHYLGKIGVETYSEMLMKYRETFLSIETEIYDECERKLFMLVY
ncbi:lower collar protein [Bacillus phage DK2]|uniref:Lower collar protein n=1 Tax=Bacillus phage DK2 TaxID=2500809 RepID=A0A3T0IIY7_9CAUD|nr:adaptor Ad4 [Bacillus phage DK2]AZU99786.1 lower collar protein [Bacillus phage DK2]